MKVDGSLLGDFDEEVSSYFEDFADYLFGEMKFLFSAFGIDLLIKEKAVNEKEFSKGFSGVN